MVTILIVNEHHGVNLGHIIYLILGDRVDLHLVKHLHEAAVRSAWSGFDNDDGLLEVFVTTHLFSGFIVSSLRFLSTILGLK